VGPSLGRLPDVRRYGCDAAHALGALAKPDRHRFSNQGASMKTIDWAWERAIGTLSAHVQLRQQLKIVKQLVATIHTSKAEFIMSLIKIIKVFHRIFVIAPLTALLGTPAWALSFSDASLNLSDYSISTYHQTGTVTITNTGTDGNPGAALSVSFNTPAPAPFTFDLSSNAIVAKSFAFDPTSVAPGYEIGFSIDKNVSYTPSSFGAFNAQGFLLSQGGQLFLHVVPLSNTFGVFQTATFASTFASDFVLFDPATGAVNAAVNPNLASGVMQFGFTSSLSLPPGAPSVQARSVYDNFSVSITAVPEPGTYALLMAGMFVLFACRRLTDIR
jgi:hypothetical protein